MKKLIKYNIFTFLFRCFNLLSLMLFFLVFIVNSFYAQNCNIECDELLLNTELDILPEEWPLQSSELPSKAFYHELVEGWYSSHGTAHIGQIDDTGNWDLSFTNPNGTETNGLVLVSNSWREGIFQNVQFSNDPFISYCLDIKFKILWIDLFGVNDYPNHSIRVCLASDLVNSDEHPFSQNVPNRIIGTVPITTFETVEETIPFSVAQNESFDQLWIYNDLVGDQDGTSECTTIESISLTCSTSALTDILVDQNGLDFEFSAENSSSSSDFITYHWNFGDGNESIEENPSHKYAQSGSYTVCLTVTDENGCCGKKCIEVIITSSCDDNDHCISIGSPGGTVNLSSLLVGTNPIPHTNNGGIIEIKDLCFVTADYSTLIIDVPLVMQNTHWYMGNGSSIESHSWKLDVFESTFRGCDQMWKGINLFSSRDRTQPFAYINITGSLIRDANRGINSQTDESISLYCKETHFINNIYGVYLGEEGPISSIINYFIENKFAFEEPMLPKYTNQWEWKDRADIGIRPENLAFLNVDVDNEFRNLTNGIKSYNSGIHVEGSEFTIDDYNSDASYSNYGIRLENSNGSDVTIQENEFIDINSPIFDQNGSSNNLKIYSNIFNVDTEYNVFLGPSINLIGNANGTIDISQVNIFKRKNRLVWAITSSDCNYNTLTITNNEFDITSTWVKDWNSQIMDFRRCNGESLIASNVIVMDKTYSSHVFQSPGMKFVDNDFSNENLVEGDKYLFLIKDSDNGFFKNNTSTKLYNFFDVKGYSNENVFCCNSSEYGETFKFINGEDQPSSLYANEIKELHLNQGAIIGQQPNRGNIWNLSGSSANVVDHPVNINYIEMNRFLVDVNQPGNRPVNVSPTSIMIEDWFPDVGFSKQCEEYDACNKPLNSGGNGGNNGGGQDTITDTKIKEVVTRYVMICKYISNGNSTMNSDLHDWVNIMYIYEYMMDYPEVNWEYEFNVVSDSLDIDCIRVITDEHIDWYDVEEDITNIYTLSDNDVQIIEQSQSIINDNIELINDWFEISPDSISEVILTYQRNIVTEMETINTINTTMHNTARSRAQAVLDKLDKISVRYPFLMERKNVWLLEMKKIIYGIDALTDVNKSELLRIVGLCQLDYGKAVYEASSLLDILGVEHDEITTENNCIDNMQPRDDSKKYTEYSIYPNPTTGLIHLSTQNSFIDKIEIYNEIGKKIISKKLNTNMDNFVIDMSKFENGLYIYKLKTANTEVSSGKLILMK